MQIFDQCKRKIRTKLHPLKIQFYLKKFEDKPESRVWCTHQKTTVTTCMYHKSISGSFTYFEIGNILSIWSHVLGGCKWIGWRWLTRANTVPYIFVCFYVEFGTVLAVPELIGSNSIRSREILNYRRTDKFWQFLTERKLPSTALLRKYRNLPTKHPVIASPPLPTYCKFVYKTNIDLIFWLHNSW